ncbi:metal ABC transporter permease [Amphritea japonica]|uniref:Zinc/manganese transport system permease protein n=1 Tax=Amphritea japonica ATCC BAA-1530 TaxID=1278309 RepID=A0A7R6PBH7_9GAMM|nr:metal ABC transporter permease [Amphritea japonica]BBB26962.1 zinc/manganese transport system permease protein [Amphritea japonica ATCC BAA-1530]
MQLLEIGLPVLVAGLLILASHIPLGYQVLKRGIVFIDLAIAQVAALGTVLASQMLRHNGDQWLLQGMAIVFALLAVGLVAWINKNFPEWREAFIGLLYVTAASVLVLLVAGQPRGGQLLTSTLSGDILWLNWQDLILLALVAVFVQLLAHVWPGKLERFFYLIFAVTITLSVVKAGIYLVFVCLIAPALASIVHNRSKVWSYVVGGTGFIAGLSIAWHYDLPAAACIVVSVILSLIVALGIQRQFGRTDSAIQKPCE